LYPATPIRAVDALKSSGQPAQLTAWKLDSERWARIRRDDIQLGGVQARRSVLEL